MEPRQLQDQAELERALAGGDFLLFKHSQTCPISARAFREYRQWLAIGPSAPTAWIDVVAQRPWSRLVEERTGVAHESPQALMLRGGRAVWNASHGAITCASLAAAVQA